MFIFQEPVEAFLLSADGGLVQRKGWLHGMCAGILKNGFPRRITLTRRLRGSSFSLSLLPPSRRFIGPRVYTVGLSDGSFSGRGEERNFRGVSVSKKNDRPTTADNSLVRLASKQRIVPCKKSAFPPRIPWPGFRADHRIPNSVTPFQARWMPTLVRRIEPEFIQRESYFRKTQLKIENRKLIESKV